jgi:hypothetical protein
MSTPRSSALIVEAHEVRKAFALAGERAKKSVQALDGVSFEVHAG